MPLIPFIPGSTALPLGGYYGTQSPLPYGAVPRTESTGVDTRLNQPMVTLHAPDYRVKTSGKPGYPGFSIIFDPQGDKTLAAAVNEAAADRRIRFGFVPTPSSETPTTSPQTTTTAPQTTARQTTAPQTTAPPRISSRYEHGIHVPHDKQSFIPITNTTNMAMLEYPIWIIINEVDSGVTPGLRGQSAKDNKNISYDAGYLLRSALDPDVPTEPQYETTIANYKQHSCTADEIASNKCLKIFENSGAAKDFLNKVSSQRRRRGGKGGKKNVYSRRKLNKTKGKRKTTKRRRSLRIRRNIIRKTKKMYK